MDMPRVVTRARRTESREDELARLIREQRDDRRQDRTGLKSTAAQEVLGAPGLFADVRRIADEQTKRYVPRGRRSARGRR